LLRNLDAVIALAEVEGAGAAEPLYD